VCLLQQLPPHASESGGEQTVRPGQLRGPVRELGETMTMIPSLQ